MHSCRVRSDIDQAFSSNGSLQRNVATGRTGAVDSMRRSDLTTTGAFWPRSVINR